LISSPVSTEVSAEDDRVVSEVVGNVAACKVCVRSAELRDIWMSIAQGSWCRATLEEPDLDESVGPLHNPRSTSIVVE